MTRTQPFGVGSLTGMAGLCTQEGGHVTILNVKAVGPDFQFLCFHAGWAEVGQTKVSKL